MRAKVTISPFENYPSKVRMGDLDYDRNSISLILKDCKRTYELRIPMLKAVAGNSFVFLGLSVGASGTFDAYSDAEWCVEIINDDHVGLNLDYAKLTTRLGQ